MYCTHNLYHLLFPIQNMGHEEIKNYIVSISIRYSFHFPSSFFMFFSDAK